MSDLIKRDDALDILCKSCGISEDVEKCRKTSADGWCKEYCELKNMPSIDAEPVRHGHWIDEGVYADNYPHHAWRCSECGWHELDIDEPHGNYCRKCGAKMDGKEQTVKLPHTSEYIMRGTNNGWGEYVGELIRCKDCKYSVDEYDDGDCYCDYNGYLSYIKDWNHYCGWAEREKETERTCYNCKHGAFGFDGDLGCSLWHRGNCDPEKCECWVGFERK